MRIGIDLGGSHIGVGLIYKDKILDTRQKNFVDSDKVNIKKTIVDTSIAMIKDLLKSQNIAQSDIELIGIASPGLIDSRSIVRASNLSLENFCLTEELESRLRIKVKIRNDAKCCAMAEKKYGSLKKYKDCVFLCIGTGIGGAAFLNGKLLEPNGFSGFEFGHMIIEKDGRSCTCGKKGCFEQYASISSVKKRITTILGERPDVSGQYLREQLLIKDNPLVKLEVESWLNYLKIGIGNLIDIFEPEAICLGGSFSHYEGNPILDRLIVKLGESDTTFTTSKKPDIVLAKYKNDSGIIGATI
ncbi:MAG: ROK family protein [Clostridia bacterium]|nr:ROK family protein [Clostridia bacterium]